MLFRSVLIAVAILGLLVSSGVHASSSVPHPPFQAIPDRRFGVVETFDDPASAAAIGAGWTRVRFSWSDLQPNNDGEWNNGFFTDEMLATELAAGREVIGMIVNTPYWALNDASVPGVPRGLYLPESDAGNLWATFVRQIVSRYAGRIDRWIIWNEPDIWDPAYPGRTWGGSVAEFFQLQRVAYHVVKATNPGAQVHLSAFTYFWDANYGRTPFFSLLMDEMQNDPQSASHNFYFDVASANLYFNPDNVYDLVAWHHAQMRQRGFDKPLWLTETNAAPSADPAWPVSNPAFHITLDEQAGFVPVVFASALAAGADRIAVYKMIDTPGDRAANPEPFGLVREDKSRRPAFTAFQVASSYLSGFTRATLDHRDDLYAQVTVQRGDARVTVLWTRSPSPVQVQIPAQSTQAILADAFGGRRAVIPAGGVYAVDVPACTQPYCVTGGPPRLLVEGAPAAFIAPATTAPTRATSLAASPPTASITLQPSPTPTLEPAATFTPTATPLPSATPSPTSAPSPTPARTEAPPAPPAAPAASDVLLVTGGVILGALLVAFVAVRLSSPRRSDD